MGKKVAVKVMLDEEELEDIIFFDYDGMIIQVPKEFIKILDNMDTNVIGVA